MSVCGAGPRGGNSAGGNAPWASKSSVFALLNSDLPPPPAAAVEEEDALLAMKKDKKMKKVIAACVTGTADSLNPAPCCHSWRSFAPSPSSHSGMLQDKKAKKEKKDKDRKLEGLPGPGAEDAALQQQERPSRAEPDRSRRHAEPLTDHGPTRERSDRHVDRSRSDRHRHRQASPRREPDRSREDRQHERRRH